MAEQHGADIVSSGGSDIAIGGSGSYSAPMGPPPGAPLPPPGAGGYGAAVPPPPSAPGPLYPGVSGHPALDKFAWYSLIAGGIGVLLPFLANHVLIIIPFFGVYNGYRALGSTKRWAAIGGIVLNCIAILLLLLSFMPAK